MLVDCPQVPRKQTTRLRCQKQHSSPQDSDPRLPHLVLETSRGVECSSLGLVARCPVPIEQLEQLALALVPPFPSVVFIKDVPDMVEIADGGRDIYCRANFTPTSVIMRIGAQEAGVRERKRGADRAKKVESNVGTDRQQLSGSQPV